MSSFASLLKGLSESIIVLIVGICVETLLKIQMGAWFLVVHAVYYCIAQRISKLRLLITIPTPTKNDGKLNHLEDNKEILPIHERLQKASYLLDKLAKASSQLEAIYSIPALIILSASFLTITISLFSVIKEIFQTTNYQTVYLQLVVGALFVAFALIIIFSADLPTKEVVTFLIGNNVESINNPTQLHQKVKLLREHVLRLSTGLLSERDHTEVNHKID